MNILHHKSWHVRSKENIARVRRDEKEAEEKQKLLEKRAAIASQEARTAYLREQARKRSKETDDGDLRAPAESERLTNQATRIPEHVNLFQDVEEGLKQNYVNEEHEQEIKKEKEEYEKKIGCLVYLGQNTLEEARQKPWYEKIDRGQTEKIDANNATLKKIEKSKDLLDPLNSIRKYLSLPGVAELAAKEPKPKKIKRSDSEDFPSSLSSKRSKKKKKKLKKHKHSKDKRKKSKKSKHCSSSSESDDEDEKASILAELRRERLKREKEEREKTNKLLAKLRGENDQVDNPSDSKHRDQSKNDLASDNDSSSRGSRKQKYNSQFNPDIARQNFT